MLTEIRDLYAYNNWANRRVLDAVAALSPTDLGRDLGGSFPSVLDTLSHIMLAEWVWLSRWQGTSPTGAPDDWDASSMEALTARWDAIQSDLEAFLADLTEERCHAPVDYRNTQGEPFTNPLWQLMRHLVNHGSYHRGQVVTLLRQLGGTATSTDMINYFREQGRD